ncbi:hypothetical protein GWK47_018588 [Chionoecetes opilio]|uniref:THAP-type domain-containing protein n=1 Tax=Chionoecetes opilio TaxID=41210 RepID=A0A8J5CIJ7_CHIOP|nr:hypothetical protein GWK47_018588 [Chionoecetes opilio]
MGTIRGPRWLNMELMWVLRRMQWMRTLDIAFERSSQTICEDHFDAKWLGTRGKLVGNAVPRPAGGARAGGAGQGQASGTSEFPSTHSVPSRSELVEREQRYNQLSSQYLSLRSLTSSSTAGSSLNATYSSSRTVRAASLVLW